MSGLDDSRHLHGEYKIPGGKLVVVDAITRRGILCAVQVSGDFFLEPDTALDTINATLQRIPMHADEELIANEIRKALDPDVRLFGISPEGIATAMWRALQEEQAT